MTFFGGVTATVLTDNMKTVVLNRADGQPRFHPKMLDFADYYFVSRVCHPYRHRPRAIESTIRYIKDNFWPGLHFSTLADRNRQVLDWCEKGQPESACGRGGGPSGKFSHERPVRSTANQSTTPAMCVVEDGEGLPGGLSRQPTLGTAPVRRRRCRCV
jgi:hypothetical protein